MPLFSAFTGFGNLAFSSAPSLHSQFYDLLPTLWGTQHDQTVVGSYEEAKRYAVARKLALMSTELLHAGNQANPLTAWDLLPLLENDYLVSPGPSDSIADRQNAVASAMLLPGGAKVSNLVNSLKKTTASVLAYLPNPAALQTAAWTPSTVVTLGQNIIPATGPIRTMFVCTSGGATGPVEPTWPIVINQTVTDGVSVVWRCLGAAAKQTVYPANPGAGPGAFKDTRIAAKFLQLVDPVATLGVGWCAYKALDLTTLPSITWSSKASFSVGQSVLPTVVGASGFFYACTTAGSTGTTEPAWTTTVGSVVVDGTVFWTCVSNVSAALQVGDVVVVDPGNTVHMEPVTVLAVSNAANGAVNCTPGPTNLFFQAAFTKSHDVGTPMTTGQVPYWWSTQRLNYIVLTAAGATDQVTRAKVDALMGKIIRAVDQWAIVQPSSTTATGGTVGPLSAGAPMGCVPLGSIPFANSN